MKIISKRGRADTSRPASDIGLTSQELAEYLLCRADPIYFINKYIKVKHPTLGAIIPGLYAYQEDYVRVLQGSSDLVAVMPRQSGKTMVGLAFMLWEACFTNVNRCTMIGAVDTQHSSEMMSKLQFMVQHVPKFMMPATKYFNRHSIEFDNGCKIMTATTSPMMARGYSLDRLHFEEFAFVHPQVQQDSLLANVPCVFATQGKLSWCSTPNGQGDTFHRLWLDASAGKIHTGFKKTVMDMTQHNATWRIMMKNAVGTSAYKAQFECEFV